MTGNSKDRGGINTGGGAYIGGNVTTQGGDFIGRDRITASKQGVTPEEFLRLLAEMRQLVQQAGLEERKAQTIEADVQVVEEEVQSSQPDKDFLVQRLDGITRILKSAGNLTDAGKKLLPMTEKALQWGGMLFG